MHSSKALLFAPRPEPGKMTELEVIGAVSFWRSLEVADVAG